MGELDQDPTLRARWRKAQRDLATAENALEQHEGRNADFTAWTKEATAARNQGVAGPQVESFRDERLKKHRALYEHLQDARQTFQQVRDEAMAACFDPITVVKQRPRATKAKLRGEVFVDADIDEFLFHPMDGMTDTEGTEEEDIRDEDARRYRPRHPAWDANIVRQSGAVSSPASQASIDRRKVDVIRDRGAVWDCESVALGESRSMICQAHYGGAFQTTLRKAKIKAWREVCEAHRAAHEGHYPSIEDGTGAASADQHASFR